MYTVDQLDSVVELDDVPQSSVGAPLPMILCGEHFLHLAYLLQATPENWDGRSIRIVGEETEGEPCALVKFDSEIAHMFGPPNDEAFAGHPLASRGLTPYGVFEVKNSSWIRGLERMNSVHPYHARVAERYNRYRHFIFAFHDTTFECEAMSFEITIHRGSVSSVLRDSWPLRQI
jgi:hypothetical protein